MISYARVCVRRTEKEDLGFPFFLNTKSYVQSCSHRHVRYNTTMRTVTVTKSPTLNPLVSIVSTTYKTNLAARLGSVPTACEFPPIHSIARANRHLGRRALLQSSSFQKIPIMHYVQQGITDVFLLYQVPCCKGREIHLILYHPTTWVLQLASRPTLKLRYDNHNRLRFNPFLALRLIEVTT